MAAWCWLDARGKFLDGNGRWLVNLRLTCLCVGLVVSGCTVGGDDASGAGGASSYDAGVETGGGGGSGGGDASEAEPPSVEGTWAQLLFYASINDIPAVGQTNGSVVTVQRTTIDRDGTSLTMEVEPCAIEIDNGTPLVSTIIPDAFVESLGITTRAGALSFGAGRWRFVQDQSLQLRGVKLDDPANDSLPVEAEDPRIWDQDGDGKPGVTVRITGIADGEVYVIQRDTHGLDGEASDDRMDGLADWLTEQVVLGADNPILTTQTSSVRDPDASASYFRSTRIGEEVGCEAILAQRDELFAR